MLKSEVIVVRGGKVTPKQLQDGVSEHAKVVGLIGFSVQAKTGGTIAELAIAGAFLNKNISVTTVGELIAVGLSVGYQVNVVSSPGRGYHCTVTTPIPLPDDFATALSQVFRQMPNPYVGQIGSNATRN